MPTKETTILEIENHLENSKEKNTHQWRISIGGISEKGKKKVAMKIENKKCEK